LGARSKRAFVYVIACDDRSLYAGFTIDLARRLGEHRAGRASKYTRSRRPLRLLAWWSTGNARAARSSEARFKLLTRVEKLRLLSGQEAFGWRLHRTQHWKKFRR
jgi:putative endonuclease